MFRSVIGYSRHIRYYTEPRGKIVTKILCTIFIEIYKQKTRNRYSANSLYTKIAGKNANRDKVRTTNAKLRETLQVRTGTVALNKHFMFLSFFISTVFAHMYARCAFCVYFKCEIAKVYLTVCEYV